MVTERYALILFYRSNSSCTVIVPVFRRSPSRLRVTFKPFLDSHIPMNTEATETKITNTSSRRGIFKLASALGIVIILFVGIVIALKTAAFKPPASFDPSGITLASVPKLDIEKAARHLGEAVRIKTVSHENSTEDDTTQWTMLHDWLQTTYPAAHRVMQLQIVAKRTLLYCWPGSDSSLEPIILMAHQDVVPVTPGTEKDWKHPPFSGEIAEGAVWGRGAIDDKGSLIALFEAIEALVNSDYHPKRTVYLVSGEDEEVSGHGARAAAAYLKSKNVMAEFVLDEGMQVISDHPITDSPVALIGVAEKGFGTLKVTAKTAGGHSSMPPKENAVVTLADSVKAIVNHPFASRFDGPTADMLRTLAPHTSLMTQVAIANEWLFAPLLVSKISSTPAGAAMMHTTIAPTMLEGSPKENVLCATATAWINYRIDPHDSTTSVMEHTRQAVSSFPVTLSWHRPPDEPSSVSSSNSRAWRILALLAADSSHAPVAPSLFIGASDSRYLQAVTHDTYRFQPITSSIEDLAMIHGTNEHITLKNLQQMTEYYARLIATATN